MHHPWRDLRARAHLALRFIDLGDDGPLGCLAPGVVTLTTGLHQVERRCVLAHELVHDERGTPHAPDTREESLVEQEVARRLIELPELVDALKLSDHPREVADTLWDGGRVAGAGGAFAPG